MTSFYERKQNGDGTFSTLTHQTGSDIIIPIDIQSRLASPIQTHNAVSVPLSNSSMSSWFSADGFDKLALHLANDASTTSSMDIEWSFDQSSIHGKEVGAIPSNTQKQKSALIDVKAPWFRTYAINGDGALAHTMNAFAYLKV